MVISIDQNVGYKHNIQTAHRQLENEAKFGCFRMMLTDKTCMQKEIKSRLNCGSCYYCCSIQKLLSSCLLSKNTGLKTHKTIIMPAFYMGVKLGLFDITGNKRAADV
jgi:hypothetical protein